MAIHIDRLAVKNIGPITECNLDFGRFNLVYGHNEKGKTLLVEFIIRALFRNRSGWGLRSTDGRGQVWVSGLSGDGPVAFTPTSDDKLEDYWIDRFSGLPPRVSRLLVVKGAEVGLDGDARDGVDKQTLKELLSGHSVMDAIEEPIQKTVKDAVIGDGVIDGDRRGKLKQRQKTQKRRERLDELLVRVDRLYSGGRRAVLRSDLEDVEADLEEMEQARRHRAWQLNGEIEALEDQLSHLPKVEIDDLRMQVRSYRKDQGELQTKRDRLEELNEKSEHYRWLQEAITVYEEREAVRSLEADSRWLAVAAIALALGLLFSLLDVTTGAVLTLLVVAVTAGKYVRDLREVAAHAGAIDEVQRLEAEFEHRFGRTLSGLALLRQLREELEGEHYEAQTLADQIKDAEEELEAQRVDVADRLRALTRERVAPEAWLETVTDLQDRRGQLEGDKRRLEDELRELNVAPSDYREEPAGVAFSQDALDDLLLRQQKLRSDLDEEVEALDDLKHEICRETDDEISISWDLLLRHLQKERAEVTASYRDQTSRILAQILVCDVLDELRQQEDEKIRKHLRSPLVATPLQAITKKYESVHLDGENVYVADSLGRFSLHDLSTGAQEQVLLALRLGIAATILDNQTLFLVLDDAFQYSDWQRRQNLLEQMVRLAKNGWQITYFTMDDHIRDLFDDAGRRHFAPEYRRIDLDALTS